MKKTSPSSNTTSKVQTKLSFFKKDTPPQDKKGSDMKNTVIVLEDDDEFDDIDFSDVVNSPPSSSPPSSTNNNNTMSSSQGSSSSSQTFVIPKNTSVKPALKLSQSKSSGNSSSTTSSSTTIESFNLDNDVEIEKSMHVALKKYFRLEEFRPNQFEIIFNLVKNKQDTLVILPTGGGKSLCYQLPSLIMNGVTLVVSPLISLMHNQVQALDHLSIPSNYWNSSQKKSEITKIQTDLESGNPTYKLLYVTPELLTSNQTFQSIMRLLASRDQLSLIAIDESHCISSWGHDFRKSFRQLNFLKDTFPQVPIIALTATATEKVRSDIVESLKMRNPKCFITSFNRPNISYEIRYKDLMHNPYEDIRNFLNEHPQECGIIYCRTRNQVDELVLQLSMEKDTKTGKELFSCKSYHAGLKLSERKTVQTDWLKGKTKIIVGTIAYGMGIDKKDVRFVVHYGMPKSLEGFYQESGRAGRDGKKAKSLLYYCSREKNSIQFLISREEKLTQDRILAVEQGFNKVCEMCETASCRRKFVLEFFGESYDPSKPHGITTVTSPIKSKQQSKLSTSSGNNSTVKATLKLSSKSNSTSAPSTPTKKNSQNAAGNNGGVIIVPQIKGVEYVETCCDYCANPKKKAEEISNASFTYNPHKGASSSGGLGTKMAEDFIASAASEFDDAIEEFDDDLDEFDGLDMEEARRSEERDQNSFINRYRKQMGITNNSMITKNSHTLTKTKPTPQQVELKRKRMEDGIDNVLDALEQEEKKQKRTYSNRKSSLLPSKSTGNNSDYSSSSGSGGFVKASTLLSTSSSYRSSEMNNRSKTTSRPKSNLERFMSKK